MVLGRIFGGGQKRRQEAEEAENFRRGLEGPMAALWDLVAQMPVDQASKMLLRQKIMSRDKGELERVLQNVIYPKLDPNWQDRIKMLGRSEGWMSFDEFKASNDIQPSDRPSILIRSCQLGSSLGYITFWRTRSSSPLSRDIIFWRSSIFDA